MNRLAFLVASFLALVAWLVSNHYPPWVTFHAEIFMAAAFLIAFTSEQLSRGEARDEFTPLLAIVFCLALVPLLQLSAGLIVFAGDAWMPSAALLGAALSVLLGQRLRLRFGQRRVMEWLAALFITASVVSVGLALYQWLGLSGLGLFATEMPPKGRPFANVAQPNHLATLLFLGMLGVLFLYEIRRFGGWVAAGSCVFLEFGMVMTSSRTAWLAIAMLVIGLGATRRRSALRISGAGVVGLGASFVALLLLWRPLCDVLLLSAGREFSEQSGAGPRILLWQTALDAIWQKPWFGYGWEQGLVAQSQVVMDHPANGRLMGSAHNLLLDLFIWNGIPLGLAVFGFVLFWGWRHTRRARNSTTVYLLAAIGGVFLHALVEFPLSYTYFLLPVALMAGVLDQPTGPNVAPCISRKWTWGLTTAATALFVVTLYEYLQVEDNTRILRFETARIGSGRIESVAPDLMLLTQWRDYLRFARLEVHPGMSSDELTWVRHVTERFPHAPSQFRSALAHGLNNRPDIAARELQRLCSLHTALRCRDQLDAWHELTRTKYPQLAEIPLPKTSTSYPSSGVPIQPTGVFH